MKLHLLYNDIIEQFTDDEGTNYRRTVTRFSPGMVEAGWYSENTSWSIYRNDGWYHIKDDQEFEKLYQEL